MAFSETSGLIAGNCALNRKENQLKPFIPATAFFIPSAAQQSQGTLGFKSVRQDRKHALGLEFVTVNDCFLA
jgi:hypothetical protein